MKTLLIVKDKSDYGYLKFAKYSTIYSDADILAINIPFDACLMPQNFDYDSVKKVLRNSNIINHSFYYNDLRKIFKTDFSQYSRIILWHGNNTNDLMLLMFWAVYYNKPFFEINISNYKNREGLAALQILGIDFLKNLIGKETLVSDSRLNELQKHWELLKKNDTGFHSVNNNGFIINISTEVLLPQIINILGTKTLTLARLIGEMMSQNIFNTETFIYKIIAHFILNGKLQAIQKSDDRILNNKLTPKSINELEYSNTLIRLSI